jgi:guanyl-specific ribonuclease Sa
LLLALLLLLAWRAWSPTNPLPPASDPPSQASFEADAPAPLERTADELPAFLPAEAADTIARIRHRGPFPYPQDGSLFGNREGRLPRQPRGWYHEYTVDTPGLRHRGARRIVTGGDPPREWYYSDDHYQSFRRFDPDTPSP